MVQGRYLSRCLRIGLRINDRFRLRNLLLLRLCIIRLLRSWLRRTVSFGLGSSVGRSRSRSVATVLCCRRNGSADAAQVVRQRQTVYLTGHNDATGIANTIAAKAALVNAYLRRNFVINHGVRTTNLELTKQEVASAGARLPAFKVNLRPFVVHRQVFTDDAIFRIKLKAG